MENREAAKCEACAAFSLLDVRSFTRLHYALFWGFSKETLLLKGSAAGLHYALFGLRCPALWSFCRFVFVNMDLLVMVVTEWFKETLLLKGSAAGLHYALFGLHCPALLRGCGFASPG